MAKLPGTARHKPPTPPPPAKRNSLLPWGIGGGALVLVIIVAAFAFKSSPQPAPAPTPPPPVAKTAPPPPKPVEVKPPPPDPGPEDPALRVKWLEREQAKAPTELKRWHEEWTALLPKLGGTPREQAVRDELERLEGAAHKEFRSQFRPVREQINALVEARKVRDAIKLLREWKLPDGLDLRGTIRADLDRELARLNEIASIDEAVVAFQEAVKAGRDPGDPKEKLATHLKSPDIGIRMPAEYALRTLTVLNVTHQFRVRMNARRGEAAARIESLKRDIVEEEEGRLRRLASWEKRLQEGTRKEPLAAETLGFSGSMRFRILKFDGTNLSYGNDSVELRVGITELSPAALGLILEMAADPADVVGLVEAGHIAVRAGALDTAERLFKSAVKVKPEFAPMAPSVDKLRHGVGKLRGKATVAGDKVSVVYAFDRPDEAEDFTPLSKVKREILGGILKLEGGGGVFIADVGNVEFSRRLHFKVRTKGVEGPGAYLFGVRWEVSPGEQDSLLVSVLPAGAFKVFGQEGGDDSKLLQEGTLPAKTEEFDLVFDEKKTELLAGGKSVWSGRESPSAPMRALVGGVTVGDAPKATVNFASLDLRGRGAPEWIQQTRSERRALVESELSKEMKVLAKSKRTWSADDRTFGRAIQTPLPLEESLREAITEEARKSIEQWRIQLAAYVKTRKPAEAAQIEMKVTMALDEVIRVAPWLPMAYFYRAEWKYTRGDLTGAIADLDESLARHENFVEARVAKAELHRRMKRYEEAGQEIEAALAAVPDLARPRLTRALLDYYGDRPAEALQELNLAMRLAPEDLTLRLESLRLARIIAGPRWPSSLEIDTGRYLVRAEIAAGTPQQTAAAKDRAQRAARTLEITRAFFEETVPGKGKRTRKPIVYLFESAESYYVHADTAHGDRLEHSLGVFFPTYQQLMFFMGGPEEETFATMIHESFHEYFHSLAGSVPPWLNEGYAEYISAVRIEGEKVVASGLMQPDRVATLKRALKRGSKGIPFSVIMSESQGQFMSYEMALKYAQSWSMVHFMIHYADGRYWPAFKSYVESLIEGKSPSDALKAAFGGLDLPAMQAEWLNYIKKF